MLQVFIFVAFMTHTQEGIMKEHLIILLSLVWMVCKFWYPMDFHWSSLSLPTTSLSSPCYYIRKLNIWVVQRLNSLILSKWFFYKKKKKQKRVIERKKRLVKSLSLLNFTCFLFHFYWDCLVMFCPQGYQQIFIFKLVCLDSQAYSFMYNQKSSDRNCWKKI